MTQVKGRGLKKNSKTFAKVGKAFAKVGKELYPSVNPLVNGAVSLAVAAIVVGSIAVPIWNEKLINKKRWSKQDIKTAQMMLRMSVSLNNLLLKYMTEVAKK